MKQKEKAVKFIQELETVINLVERVDLTRSDVQRNFPVSREVALALLVADVLPSEAHVMVQMESFDENDIEFNEESGEWENKFMGLFPEEVELYLESDQKFEIWI